MIVYEAEFEKGSDKYDIDKIKELDLKPKFLKDSLINEKDILHLINRT